MITTADGTNCPSSTGPAWGRGPGLDGPNSVFALSEDVMDFDKDNFEEDNELAPLEEEEAGDVDEVAGVEIDEIVAEDDTEDESEASKRASTGPKRGSAGSSGASSGSGRTASRAATGKSGGARKGPAKKASVGKSKSSARKSAKKKSGSARGKASKKPA